MTGTRTRSPRLRSAAALLLGLLTGIILTIGTDIIMHATRVFPQLGQPMPDALLLLATTYRTVYSAAASYIAARMAPARPMQHALLLGALGFIVSAIGAAVTWNRGPAFGPHWYPLALVVLAMPCAWVGGKLGSPKAANLR